MTLFSTDINKRTAFLSVLSGQWVYTKSNTIKFYSKRQKYMYFGRLLAPTACRKAAIFLIRSRVHPPEGYSKRHFLMSFTIILNLNFIKLKCKLIPKAKKEPFFVLSFFIVSSFFQPSSISRFIV